MDDLSREELLLLLQEKDATNTILQELNESLQKQNQAQQEQLESLASEIKLLKRSLFGRRRERFDDPRQGTLFDSEILQDGPDDPDPDDPDADGSEGESDDDKGSHQEPDKKKRGGGRRGRIVIPEAMPRKQVVHQLKDENIPEHLRGRDDLRTFTKKVGQYIEFVAAHGVVVEEYVEVLAADNEDKTATEMASASRPPRILDCYAGNSLLAEIVVDRFADYLPYYRLEERLNRLGLKIPRGTIARWMVSLSDVVKPLIDLMRKSAIASAVACMDETPVKLLKPELAHAATAYVWTLVGDDTHPYNVYYFTTDRSRAGPETFLEGFSGTLVSDAYVAYESLQKEWSDRMTWACCHAHARRKFEEVHFLGATRQTIKAMSFYRLLFDLEDEAREMTPNDRHAFRQQKTRPVIEKFKTWMDERLTTLRPKHPLRKPINYLTKRWDSFTRFLESPDVPFDNNVSERSVKLPVMAKKSHLFFASQGGGEAAVNFYSLTSTCRRLHINPTAYLIDLFERLPTTPQSELRSLLPDQWIAENPEHRVKLREDEAKQTARAKKQRRAKRRKQLKRAVKAK